MAYLPRYSSFEDFMQRAPWWARLDSFGNDQPVAYLRASIQSVATSAFVIAKRITAWMPFYTLHDERHLLNLLGWIEALTPQETLNKLLPLEVGLTILGVLTHDLGMALPEVEHHKLLLAAEDTAERRGFLQFAEGRFEEELHMAEQLERSAELADKRRAELIRQHILSEFLRSTHAPPTGQRIKRWLDEMKLTRANGTEFHNDTLFHFGQTDYQMQLVAIAASHNQTVDWLRRELDHKHGGFHQIVRNNERVNFAFPGLLLRLADIMDFDSSRTPSILYRHLGLNEDLGIDLSISQHEWNKHLAITGIEINAEAAQPCLTYAAPHCPHPVIEKSIREFLTWIQAEVRGVHDELARQQHDPNLAARGIELVLPDVKPEIHAKRINGRPAYIYEDIQFKLDQDEILQLLMGENLYGDPTLCIRELLQNSLDACELRDLRLQLKAKGDTPFEPVDGVPAERGFFLNECGQKQHFEIHLTWGYDEQEERYWLQVADNGVGMTEEKMSLA
jgi:molecular chaperone HtpG